MTGLPDQDPLPTLQVPAPLGRAARLRRFIGNVCATRLDKSGFRLRLIALAFSASMA